MSGTVAAAGEWLSHHLCMLYTRLRLDLQSKASCLIRLLGAPTGSSRARVLFAAAVCKGVAGGWGWSLMYAAGKLAINHNFR